MRQRQWLVSIFICTFTRSLEHTHTRISWNILSCREQIQHYISQHRRTFASVRLPQPRSTQSALLIIFCILNTVRALYGASLARLSPLFVFVLFGWRWSMVLRCVFRLFHFHFNRNSSTNDICLLLLALSHANAQLNWLSGVIRRANGNGGDADVIIRVIEINALRMLIKTIWRHTHPERDRHTRHQRNMKIIMPNVAAKFIFFPTNLSFNLLPRNDGLSSLRRKTGKANEDHQHGGMSACGGNV